MIKWRRAIIAALGILLLASAPVFAASAPVARAGGSAGKTIALTFDDGWNVGACQSIFHTLQVQHVPATFFPYSAALTMHSNSAAFWRSVAQAGYPIASHSQTHPNMTTLSYAGQLAQLTNSAADVLRVTGVPVLPVFRPPGGSYNSNTLAAASAAGYQLVLNWDTSDEDTAISNIPQEIADAEKGGAGSVVLMHCGPSTTPYVVPDVIAYYRARGFTFVTVATMFNIPYAGPAISFISGSVPPIATYAPPPPAKASPTPIVSPKASSPSPSPRPSPSPSPSPNPTANPSPSLSPTFSPSPSLVPALTSTPSASGSSTDVPSLRQGPDAVLFAGLVALAFLLLMVLVIWRRRTTRPL